MQLTTYGMVVFKATTSVLIALETVFPIYDIVLTLGSEITLIWGKKMNAISYLYLLNRYSFLFILMIDLWGNFAANPTQKLYVFPAQSCNVMIISTLFQLPWYLHCSGYAGDCIGGG